MTGGRVVVIGRTGRNFAAGMSGGIAYVLDQDGLFERRCNREMVDLEPLIEAEDLDFVQVAIMKHVTYTGSRHAERLLADWPALQKRVIKVVPREYKRALAAEAKKRSAVDVIPVPAAVRVKGASTHVSQEAGVRASTERQPQA
jgi:glutamate synthase (ferredoxin)